MSGKILLTGATGYVGGRLLQRLAMEGYEVNCLCRNPSRLHYRAPGIAVFEGDLLFRSSMWQAFQGVETAYYLVHSLADRRNTFEAHEIEAAENFAAMARSAGVKRIIYLGSLGRKSDELSAHIRSRQDVGYILRHSGVDTLELRSSIVLGAGSLSFEMIRALTEHLPVMIMPRWVSIKTQPIGIRDLLDYLVQSIDLQVEGSRIIEIGGRDQVSYRDLMTLYARCRGLHRLMIPVPVLTPRLSSHWLRLVTPLQAAVGRNLIESIRNATVVNDGAAEKLFDIHPGTAAEAMAQALMDTPPLPAGAEVA